MTRPSNRSTQRRAVRRARATMRSESILLLIPGRTLTPTPRVALRRRREARDVAACDRHCLPAPAGPIICVRTLAVRNPGGFRPAPGGSSRVAADTPDPMAQTSPPPFLRPTRLDEALGAAAMPGIRLLAGGTDFFPAQGDRPVADPV